MWTMKKLATNQADVKDEAKSFNDMLGEEGLSTLTSLVNKVKSLGVVFVEKVGPEIEKIVVSIQDWLNTGGMDSLVEGAKSLANTMISIVQNMDKVLVAEESDGKYGFSSEIISNLSEDKECKNIDFKRITSNKGVIPASVDLEKKYFINKDKLFDIMNKLLDNA